MNKTKVLIVENEPLIAREVRMSLERLGYEVTATAASYQDALLQAHESKPDIALMDINIDGNKDGIQTAKALKSHYNIPIIFLTSLKELETVQKAKESDPFGYLVKPFRADDLQTSIEIALFNHSKTNNLQGNLDKFTSAMHTLETPVIILNENGMIDYINAQVERMTAWKKDEKRGASVNQILNIDGLPAWLYIGKFSNEPERTSVGFKDKSVLLSKTGKQIPVAGRVSFFHTPETGISGYVITLNSQDESENGHASSTDEPVSDFIGQIVDNYFFLKDKSSLYRIHVDHITYIEALGNYVKVHTEKKSYTALIPLKDIEKILPPHQFFRIHRSYIVAIDKITAIHATELQVPEATIPIGKTFKDDLIKRIQVI